MRQIAIAFTALAFLAVPAAAEAKCDDYGGCLAKRKDGVALQTSPPVDQPADDSAGPAVHQKNGLQTDPPVVQPADPFAYRIGPADVLEVKVFQADELTSTVQVDPTGQITLPLLGAVQAGGKTAPDVAAEIASRLKAKYMKSPQVSVYIKEFNSQRITVEGAVNKPGMLPIAGQMSLLQAVASSGGFDANANSRNVVIFRTIGGQRSAAKFNVNKIRAGKAPDPNVQSGDIIVVPESGVRKGLNDVLKVLPLGGLFMGL